MKPEILLHHLRELGALCELSEDLSQLLLDAPDGVLTDELTEIIREHKDALIDLVFSEIEREAIEEEGKPSVVVEFKGEAALIAHARARIPDAVIDLLTKRGGATLEVTRAA